MNVDTTIEGKHDEAANEDEKLSVANVGRKRRSCVWIICYFHSFITLLNVMLEAHTSGHTAYHCNMAKGHIAVLLPLVAVNAFIRCVHWADTFASGSRQTLRNALEHRYVTMGQHMPSSQVPIPMGASGSHLIYGSSGSREFPPPLAPNGISIGSLIFAELACVTNTCTNRHTHRSRYLRNPSQ